MGQRDPRDMLNKASWTMLEGMKDSVAVNLTQALRTKQVAVDEKEFPKLIALINASLEEGYHKGFRLFDRTVSDAVTEAVVRERETKKNTGRP